MTHHAPHQDTPEADIALWSARNLPPQKATPLLRLSLLAGAAGLVAIVLVAAVARPIQTAGTRMEPVRFQSQVPGIRTAPAPIFVAADLRRH